MAAALAALAGLKAVKRFTGAAVSALGGGNQVASMAISGSGKMVSRIVARKQAKKHVRLNNVQSALNASQSQLQRNKEQSDSLQEIKEEAQAQVAASSAAGVSGQGRASMKQQMKDVMKTNHAHVHNTESGKYAAEADRLKANADIYNQAVQSVSG